MGCCSDGMENMLSAEERAAKCWPYRVYRDYMAQEAQRVKWRRDARSRSGDGRKSLTRRALGAL